MLRWHEWSVLHVTVSIQSSMRLATFHDNFDEAKEIVKALNEYIQALNTESLLNTMNWNELIILAMHRHGRLFASAITWQCNLIVNTMALHHLDEDHPGNGYCWLNYFDELSGTKVF